MISKSFLLVLLALVLIPMGARAQDSATEELQAAASRFQSGDRAGGLSALDSLAVMHPTDPRVFATIGQFRRQNQEFEASLAAFRRAAELDPATASNHFNAGVAFALVDRMDEAFDALFRARDGGFNVLNVASSPAAQKVTADPRYATLFPTPEQYADPFVEGTRIIHDWTGENAGDQFGWIARNVGDVDGDSVNDAVSSAPTHSEGAPSGGKIYVYSGKSGRLLWSAVGRDANGQLGSGVEAAGDVNADGIPDVVAGAPYAGKAVVYSGRDGRVLHELASVDSTGAFGASVRGVGDADGDGYDDVLIGEPHQMWGAPLPGGTLEDPGQAHLYSGRTGSVLHTWTGRSSGDGFGATLAGKQVGDTAWSVIGAPSAGAADNGEAYVFHDLADEPSLTLSGADTSVGFGAMFMSVMGDADGDGTVDFLVTSAWSGIRGFRSGRTLVISGRNP